MKKKGRIQIVLNIEKKSGRAGLRVEKKGRIKSVAEKKRQDKKCCRKKGRIKNVAEKKAGSKVPSMPPIKIKWLLPNKHLLVGWFKFLKIPKQQVHRLRGSRTRRIQN